LTLKMGAGYFTHVEIRTQIAVELLWEAKNGITNQQVTEQRVSPGQGATANCWSIGSMATGKPVPVVNQTQPHSPPLGWGIHHRIP